MLGTRGRADDPKDNGRAHPAHSATASLERIWAPPSQILTKLDTVWSLRGTSLKNRIKITRQSGGQPCYMAVKAGH